MSVLISAIDLFNGLSKKASTTASFVLTPNAMGGRDTSSADRITFGMTHTPTRWDMPMHGNYGVFMGGAGMYPASEKALASAFMSHPEPKNPTLGFMYQDVSGVKKGT